MPLTDKPAMPLTCSIKEASEITGLSTDYLRACARDTNPQTKLPGFITGSSHYRVVVSALDDWLRRKAKIEGV